MKIQTLKKLLNQLPDNTEIIIPIGEVWPDCEGPFDKFTEAFDLFLEIEGNYTKSEADLIKKGKHISPKKGHDYYLELTPIPEEDYEENKACIQSIWNIEGLLKKGGRPKGKSKLDKYEPLIRELLQKQVFQKAIAKKLDCTEATLSKWLKKHHIKKELQTK